MGQHSCPMSIPALTSQEHFMAANSVIFNIYFYKFLFINLTLALFSKNEIP